MRTINHGWGPRLPKHREESIFTTRMEFCHNRGGTPLEVSLCSIDFSFAHPIGMENSFTIGTFVGVRAEVVTLCLE